MLFLANFLCKTYYYILIMRSWDLMNIMLKVMQETCGRAMSPDITNFSPVVWLLFLSAHQSKAQQSLSSFQIERKRLSWNMLKYHFLPWLMFSRKMCIIPVYHYNTWLINSPCADDVQSLASPSVVYTWRQVLTRTDAPGNMSLNTHMLHGLP